VRRPEQVGVEVVPEGLLMAMLRPPVGRDAEFNDWYDTEHAPARNDVPGFLTARRWRVVPGWDGGDTVDPAKAAVEEAEPLRYMATFDLDELEVLDGADYLGLREKASQRERELNAAFTENDRRVYRPAPLPAVANGDDLNICGPYMLATWWETDGDARPEPAKPDFLEHVNLAMGVEGLRRIRLFERVDAPGPGRYAALYDLDSLAVFRHDGGAPPWLASATDHQPSATKRLYALWCRFDQPLPQPEAGSPGRG
jgi:hypothetical protein